MKTKRGQIAIFFIIAIIIFVALSIYLFSKSNPSKNAGEIDVIHNYIYECIKETGESTLVYLGATGGYAMIPSNSLDSEVAYYFYEGESLMPSISKIERDASFVFDDLLLYCINDFYDFEDYDITYKKSETNMMIENEPVFFEVNFPVKINKGKTIESFDFFELEIPVRLGLIYKTINEIMQEQKSNPENLCISCVYDISKSNNMTAYLMDDENSSVLFVIRDEESFIKGSKYSFYFANKYNWEINENAE